MAHLRLLGGAHLADAAGHAASLASRRHAMAILALLAAAPSRTLSRNKLVGLLWPGSPEAKGRNRLNTYVYQIRRELGDDALMSTGEDVRLDDTRVRCDLWDFERALEAGDEEAAVALYRGPYLDGFRFDDSPEFEQRVDLDRSRLRRAFHDALEAVAEAAEDAGDPAAAARRWRERADEDPYDSRVTRRLMLALAAAGNRAEALRVADVHARRLESELEARPSAEVASLAESLRARGAAPRDTPPAGSWARALPARGQAANARSGGPDRHADRAGERPPVWRKEVPPGDGRTGRRALWKPVLLALLVVAVGGWYLAVAPDPSAGGTDAGRAIAILPFESLPSESGMAEESSAALAEGLHSDLSTRLAGIPGLDVRPRATVLEFRGDERPPSEIAADLGVRWLLVAEVQRSGDQVRLHARLVDAHAGRQVWTRTFGRQWTAGRLFDMQGEIAGSIAAALEVQLSSDDERRLRAVPTENTAAYELYLQARELDRSLNAIGAADREIGLYRRALELDPQFAEGWAWLADAYMDKAWGGEGVEAWTDSALAAVGRALELDPDLADAHSQLGDAYWTLGRMEDAIGSYERALDLQPSHSEAINNLLTLLERRGRLADKMKWTERARRLVPGSAFPIAMMASLNSAIGRDAAVDSWLEYGRARGHDLRWTEFGIALHHRGDVDRARAVLEELAGEEGGYQIDRRRAALALYSGDLEEARRHYRRLYPGVARASSPLYRGLLWDALGLAHVLDRLGDTAQAREIAREVVEAAEGELAADPDHLPRHRLAVASLILGDTASALGWLEDAVDGGHRDVRLLETVPTLAPLRDQPSFRALLGRMRTLVAEERRRIEAEGWGTPEGARERGASVTSR